MSYQTPTLIARNQVGRLRSGGRTTSPAQHSRVYESGMSVGANDGIRMIFSASTAGITYIQMTLAPGSTREKGAFYVQNVMGFDQDTGFSGAIALTHLSATKSVISDFLDIYKGIVSVAGGPVAAGIIGMDIIVGAGNIKRNYQLYKEALLAFTDNNMELSRTMQTFWETMYVELVFARIESELKSQGSEILIKGIVKNDAITSIIGVFIGKCGEDAMSRTLKGVSKIIKEVLLKVLEHRIEGKTIDEEQVKLLATKHLMPMYSELSRLNLRQDRAEAIIRQTANDPIKIKDRLKKISAAIDVIP